MKTRLLFLCQVLALAATSPLLPQQRMNLVEYLQLSHANQGLSYQDLTQQFPLSSMVTWDHDPIPKSVQYLDSIDVKFHFTSDELQLLQKNRFMVTERLSRGSMDKALMEIYKNDLPVFITTDMALNALHFSYDEILPIVEDSLQYRVSSLVKDLRMAFPALVNRYKKVPALRTSLVDLDLFTAVAYRLNYEADPHPSPPEWPFDFFEPDTLRRAILADSATLDHWVEAVYNEKFVEEFEMFSDIPRHIDFSQFKPRGRYWDRPKYFRTMTWFSWAGFTLAAPASYANLAQWQRAVRRMTIDAYLLNELVDLAGARPQLAAIEAPLSYLVGECDNLDIRELNDVFAAAHVSSAADLLDESVLQRLQTLIQNDPAYQAKIFGFYFHDDLPSEDPHGEGVMPIEFKLIGQRFIIDSFIFSEVVYDRILINNQPIWRPLPDPLDIVFSLGNNNALYLLQEQVQRYSYGGQLATVRAWVESVPEQDWQSTFYNHWLNAIRKLPAPRIETGTPDFMKTPAWQQEKINSQLASWAQLRYDNLLYAKQSYTAGAACSYPHSYIEPVPEVFGQLSDLASQAQQKFAEFGYHRISEYFLRAGKVFVRLESLAKKELARQAFNQEEISFLKKMLYETGDYNTPPFSGWFADLYYELGDVSNFDGTDYIIADVHTQPTDDGGNIVGNVLHVGIGKVNLGFFIAPSPSLDFKPMLYCGPVLSYYETVASDFKRLTTKEWADSVAMGLTPPRPDWVNCYLADSLGRSREKGREIPIVLSTGLETKMSDHPLEFELYSNYPNPFNPTTRLSFSLPADAHVSLSIYNSLGQRIRALINGKQSAGQHQVIWDGVDDYGIPAVSGLYLSVLQVGAERKIRKMTLIK